MYSPQDPQMASSNVGVQEFYKVIIITINWFISIFGPFLGH